MTSLLHYSHKLLAVLSLSSLLMMSCSSTKDSTKLNSDLTENNEQLNTTSTASSELTVNLDNYRNQLSDVYASRKTEVPDAFKPLPSQENHEISNIGYRVQILSSENKNSAEKMVHAYNDWIFQQKNISYKGVAHIIFKQPYYRVQIGDFISRERAIEYSKKLKRKYRNAWVVQDKINPDMIPSKMDKNENQNQQNQN
jgi:hypothetical protein